jgi:hypothetical protein
MMWIAVKMSTEIKNHSANEIDFQLLLRYVIFKFLHEFVFYAVSTMSKAEKVYSERSTLAEKPPFFFPLGELKVSLAG